MQLEATPRVELGIKDLQSSALPLGYVALCNIMKMATRMGLEPMISAVTGRHSNQLNYRAATAQKRQSRLQRE